MSEELKPWYSSRGVWGGITTLICLVLGVLGYSVSPEDSEQLVLAMSALGGIIGSIIGVYGRLKAQKQLR